MGITSIDFDFFSWFATVGDFLQSLFAIFSLYGVYAIIRDWSIKRVELSIGSFRVRRRDFDVQKITNIVSANYFDGGQVPPDIRKEILHATNPKTWKLKRDKEQLERFKDKNKP